MQDKTAILLLNLGTPDDPSVSSVRRYLREFLSDPKVIDLPAPLRWTLLNLFILPFRPKQSAHAYQSIWTEQGSPLLFNSQALAENLQTVIGDDCHIVLGMRYGKPSIQSAVQQIKQYQRVIVLPLFPQFSQAATGSAIEKALTLLKKECHTAEIKIINDFYQHPLYIDSLATSISNETANKKIDHYLLSYHGLPVRHIKKSGCGVCPQDNACPEISENNALCYRAQCYATSRALAKQLQFADNQYSTCFQSRLGKNPWIAPQTDLIFQDLINHNIKTIAVACPSFVADCLETLEEIGLRAREQWQQLGGEELVLIPCLNSEPYWIEALAKILKTH